MNRTATKRSPVTRPPRPASKKRSPATPAPPRPPRDRRSLPTPDLSNRLGLSQAEAAAALGKSPSCLRLWARKGLGPKFIRVGTRALIYATADLKSFLARNANDPADVAGK